MKVLLKDKQAVIDYLEFNLFQFVEKYEGEMDLDAVGAFYADAAALLNDMDDTLQMAVESTTLVQNQTQR
jgi:exonuclease VII small subunit